MKIAVLQMADQGPAESTAVMLHAAGYNVYLPNDQLRNQLRKAGCDLVLSPADLTRGLGYDPVDLPEIGPEAMDTCDLYCDVKAHRNGPRVWRRWPRLQKRTLWTRINGCAPEHVINARGDHGDEVNLCCPILTPNLFYVGSPSEPQYRPYWDPAKQPAGPNWGGMAYACWPPFARFDEYAKRRPVGIGPYEPPLCLVHGAAGWGYGALFENMRRMGVRIYGEGSPDGLVPHANVKHLLSLVLCMVHLKSSDAPGFSLYEALAAACPVVCTRRLIWRCRMQDLLIPGETCLVFDRETHDGLTPDDVAECTHEVGLHLERLRDPAENRRIGMAGRKRLAEVMWRPDRDGDSLRAFFARNFPE